MTIVTVNRATMSALAGDWRHVNALGLLDRLLARQARANAAAAVEDSRRRLHRSMEESEMLLVCPAAVREPAVRV